MSTEKPPRKIFRAPDAAGVNVFDCVESEPELDQDATIEELCDRLYEFICQRFDAGDPCRWRCLITRFGEPFGSNAHYKISYAVGKLKTARLVKIVDRLIPERIVPTRRQAPVPPGQEYKFGRLHA